MESVATQLPPPCQGTDIARVSVAFNLATQEGTFLRYGSLKMQFITNPIICYTTYKTLSLLVQVCISMPEDSLLGEGTCMSFASVCHHSSAALLYGEGRL